MNSSPATITILGLGPGDPKYLTVEAAGILDASHRIYLSGGDAIDVTALRHRFPHLDIRRLDGREEYPPAASPHEHIAAQLLGLARDAGVVCCVPGSPSMAGPTVGLIRTLAEATETPVRIVEGVSCLEPSLAAVGKHDTSWLSLVDGAEIDLLARANALGEIAGSTGHVPVRIPVPTVPLLVYNLGSTDLLSSVKSWLRGSWPPHHHVALIASPGNASQTVNWVGLLDLETAGCDSSTVLFVPAVSQTEDVRTFTGLLNVTRTLRAPGGCPWDREQTHDSLKTHLIEETYEAVEALDRRQYDNLVEELGDLLFQVAIHAQIAREHDEFGIEDVIAGVTSKLIRRHPHVFGDLDLSTSAAVLERWEGFKQVEKPSRQSILSSIPEAMPAMPYSFAVQKRAANQGFAWSDIESLMAKVDEELMELHATVSSGESRERLLEELGDLFFVLVSVGRCLKIDPEEALRKANRKFVHRFKLVEQACKSSEIGLRDLSEQDRDRLWEEAKSKP